MHFTQCPPEQTCSTVPVAPSLDAVEADGAVGSEQDDHVSEDVEQQGVREQLGDGGEGVVQVGGAVVESQLWVVGKGGAQR